MAKKMTAKDYRNAYKSLISDINSLDAKITMRLIELSKVHPDAPIAINIDSQRTTILAKSLTAYYVHNLQIDKRLEYIEAIETYLAEQHPHKQLSINFQ